MLNTMNNVHFECYSSIKIRISFFYTSQDCRGFPSANTSMTPIEKSADAFDLDVLYSLQKENEGYQ